MLCAHSRMWQCYPVICAWPADYFENTHLNSIKQPHYTVCEAPKLSFGEGNSLPWQLRYCQLYFQKMILANQGDEMERREARQYLEDRAVGTSEGGFWNMKCISPTTIIIPDIPHTVYLGMLKHLMHWVMFFLKQHSRINEFNQLWAMCLHILASLDSTSHIARWHNGAERRWKHSGIWLVQYLQQLFQTLWRAKCFPSQKPCCASRT